MSKREFGAGTIVRKKTKIGVPIGPWMKVVMANAHYVYATPLHCKDLTLIQRDNVYKAKVLALCISEEKIEHIIHGDIAISHIATSKWAALLDEKNRPDIIMFYTVDGWKKVWCTIETVYLRCMLGDRIVRVIIDRVIDRYPLL